MSWKNRDKAEMRHIAEAWFAEKRGQPISDQDAGMSVTILNFSAPAEQQWMFIVQAIEEAESEDELFAVAAGPIERLLGKHGNEYIKAAESLASENDKFAVAMTGLRQYMMSDAIWARVKVMQQRVEKPQ